MKKILLTLLSIIISVFIFAYIKVISNHKSTHRHIHIENLIEDIKRSKPLTREFYEVYNKIYPERLTKNLNQHLLYFQDKKTKQPNSLRVARIVGREGFQKFERLSTLENLLEYASLTWAIEEKLLKPNA